MSETINNLIFLIMTYKMSPSAHFVKCDVSGQGVCLFLLIHLL